MTGKQTPPVQVVAPPAHATLGVDMVSSVAEVANGEGKTEPLDVEDGFDTEGIDGDVTQGDMEEFFIGPDSPLDEPKSA